MSRFVSNSLFGALGSVIATVSGLASNIVIARMLGVKATGETAVAVWIATTAVTIFGLGIPATLSRYLPSLAGAGQHDESRQLLGRLFVLLLVAMALPVVLLLTLAIFDGGKHGSSFALRIGLSVLSSRERYVLVALLCLSWALVEYVRGYYRGVQDFKKLASITTISTICQIAVLVVAAKLFGVSGVLASYIFGALIIASPLISIRPRPSPIAKALAPRLRTYALFRWASEINATFVWSRVEVLFLQLAGGATQVGLFAAGLTLVNLAVQGIQMLSWGLLPHFSEQHSQSRDEAMRRTFQVVVRLMALAVFPMCLGLAAILPELVPLIFGTQFEGAVPSSIILVAGAMVIGPGTVATTIAWAKERSDVEFSCGVLSVVVALLGGFILVPKFGLMGAAVSRVCTQVTFVVACNLYIIRQDEFRLPLFDLARILVASLVCAAAARADLSFVWLGAKGIPSAVLVGAVTYGVALRLLQVLDAEEAARFAALSSSLPSPLATPLLAALRFLSESNARTVAPK